MKLRITKKTLRYVERDQGYEGMLTLAAMYHAPAKALRMKPARRCSIGGTRNQKRHEHDWD